MGWTTRWHQPGFSVDRFDVLNAGRAAGQGQQLGIDAGTGEGRRNQVPHREHADVVDRVLEMRGDVSIEDGHKHRDSWPYVLDD